MKTILKLSTFFLLICFSSSCSKEDDNQDIPEAVTHVYAVGHEYNGVNRTAKMWKNGVATPLTDGTYNAEAKAIYVLEQMFIY
ncbi:hypothetical protein [Gelidibacter japonicus]|uniref:hypothetical protein n=1 Tax=Gelidibacter japonicus TaxID=1962232 RepID=UPI0013D494D0|nr:hypothetical protein [Gelidibacter japonicus]